jgi:hypothetical protein
MDLKPFKVQAEIMWAFLNEPNKMSHRYQVDLCNLSPDAVKKLKDVGLTARKREDQPEKGYFITAKSKNYPIKAFDLDGNPITVKIANGSKCVALVAPYESKVMPGMICAGVKALTITDLKEYVSDAVVDLTEDVL